jgi:4-hydroxy-4-methyl-2-oxoglutarate aldolase
MASDGLLTSNEAYSAAVADALDAAGLRQQSMDPRVQSPWCEETLVGRALTVHIVSSDVISSDDPYADWIDLIERVSPGQVLVLGVEPGVLAATWGELFSCAAIGRGALGAVTDGYIRDISKIRGLRFPLFSLGGSPLDTLGRARVAAVGQPVVCGGVSVATGDVIVADQDGVVVVPAEMAAEITAAVRQKAAKESDSRQALLDGSSVREVWEQYGVF